VEKNTDHFLRLHFCDIFNTQSQLTIFILNIYDQLVTSVNYDTEESSPYYYDFVIRSDASGLLNVSVIPNTTAAKPNAFLNGLELMKVIESSGIPVDNLDSNSKKISFSVVLGSILGGLVLVSIFLP
jgi:hypothetical protein